MSEILKNRILELEVQRFIDLPNSGFRKSVSAKRPSLISLVRDEFSIDDNGNVINHNVGNDKLSLAQFFEGGIAGHELFYDAVHLEAKKIKAEMRLYPDATLKAMSQGQLWDRATEIAEKRLAKSERGRAT